MRKAGVRELGFVAFWACFVSRVRSPSGPARRVGALRWARDALLELFCSGEQAAKPAKRRAARDPRRPFAEQ